MVRALIVSRCRAVRGLCHRSGEDNLGCKFWRALTVYAQKFSLALQLQPQCFGGLTLIAWGQTLYYSK